MNSKKRILLFWGTHRKDWREVFDRLSEDFEFTYLFYVFPSDNPAPNPQLRELYWNDFPSVQAILKEVKPDKVLFMATEPPQAIALNHICKKRGIPTYVLQHGLFHSLAYYIRVLDKRIASRGGKSAPLPKGSKGKKDLYQFLLAFLFRSLFPAHLGALAHIFRLQRYKRKLNEYRAWAQTASPYRWADHYLVYTRYNARIYRERDQVPSDRMIEVGNPNLDHYFHFQAGGDSLAEGQAYLLYIDHYVARTEWDEQQLNAFYLKLNTYAEQQGYRLKVKLHPYSYGETFYIEHPNIDFIKDADVVPLLMQARGVMGGNSTLMIPALYFKPCCLFSFGEMEDFQESIQELGMAPLLNAFQFEAEDIRLMDWEKAPEALEAFVTRYLYKPDGQAADRIKKVLLR
jgi:hypothetical protein